MPCNICFRLRNFLTITIKPSGCKQLQYIAVREFRRSQSCTRSRKEMSGMPVGNPGSNSPGEGVFNSRKRCQDIPRLGRNASCNCGARCGVLLTALKRSQTSFSPRRVRPAVFPARTSLPSSNRTVGRERWPGASLTQKRSTNFRRYERRLPSSSFAMTNTVAMVQAMQLSSLQVLVFRLPHGGADQATSR